jgi:hypothetical protein
MEPEGVLLHSQKPTTCPYPKPDPSNPCSHIPLPEDQYECFNNDLLIYLLHRAESLRI